MRWIVAVLVAVGLGQAQTVLREEPIPERPAVGADEIAAGERLFTGHCAGCNGPGGQGASGPKPARPDLRRAHDAESLFLIVDLGIDGTEMPRGVMYISEPPSGAATTWVTGSYDPALNTIYWGTGNPGPDWNGEVGEGDNFYSDSLIALDADTGKLKWHFQFTPHDLHDWDATEVPVLIDGEVRGKKRKLVLFANRNAFYYVLDREMGAFLVGKQYAKQTWAEGLDDSGKPMRLPNTFPTVEGVRVYPAVGGATNWFSPSYSPSDHLFFVNIAESGRIYHQGEAIYRPTCVVQRRWGSKHSGGGRLFGSAGVGAGDRRVTIDVPAASLGGAVHGWRAGVRRRVTRLRWRAAAGSLYGTSRRADGCGCIQTQSATR